MCFEEEIEKADYRAGGGLCTLKVTWAIVMYRRKGLWLPFTEQEAFIGPHIPQYLCTDNVMVRILPYIVPVLLLLSTNHNQSFCKQSQWNSLSSGMQKNECKVTCFGRDSTLLKSVEAQERMKRYYGNICLHV